MSGTDDELMEVEFDAREGMVDLTLPIDRLMGGDGAPWGLRARGRLHGIPVGLEIVVRPGMRPGLRKNAPTSDDLVDRTAFYSRGIVIRSLGPASTALFLELAAAYGLPKPDGNLPPEVSFTSFALHGDPRRLLTERVDFKLFFDQAGPAQYFELFMNVDLPGRNLELREKDEDYRAPLLQALLSSKSDDRPEPR